MKNYRCVFNYSNGRTQTEIDAANAEQALQRAKDTVEAGDAKIEVWDETGLVISRDPTRVMDFKNRKAG